MPAEKTIIDKNKFKRIYSNIPSGERKEIIVIIDSKPYTWDRANDEISNDTELGNKIIKKMIELRLL